MKTKSKGAEYAQKIGQKKKNGTVLILVTGEDTELDLIRYRHTPQSPVTLYVSNKNSTVILVLKHCAKTASMEHEGKSTYTFGI